MENTLVTVQTLKQCLKGHQVSPKDQRLVVENMLAELLAYRCPLPNGALADPASYFRTHCKVEILESLAKINEHLVFNLDAACDLTFKLWDMRYRMVFRPDLPSAPRLFQIAAESGMLDERHSDVCKTYPGAHFSRQTLGREVPGQVVPTDQPTPAEEVAYAD